MKYIFITAGHSVKGIDHGASSPYGNEAIEARKLVDALAKKLLLYGIAVKTEDDSWNLINTIAWLAGIITTPDYNIDVHFNSSTNFTASGTEVLIPDNANDKEKELALKLVTTISSTLGIKSRGVKGESESQHSKLGILSNPKIAKANNLLIEVCFISSHSDMELYRLSFDKLVDNISRVINETL